MKNIIKEILANKENHKRGKAYLCMSIFGWCIGFITCGFLQMGMFLEINIDFILPVGIIGVTVLSYFVGLLDKDHEITG